MLLLVRVCVCRFCYLRVAWRGRVLSTGTRDSESCEAAARVYPYGRAHPVTPRGGHARCPLCECPRNVGCCYGGCYKSIVLSPPFDSVVCADTFEDSAFDMIAFPTLVAILEETRFVKFDTKCASLSLPIFE